MNGPAIDAENFNATATRFFDALAKAPSRELMERLITIAIAAQHDNFANARDGSGASWPLRRYHGHPILDRGRSGVPGHPLLIDLGNLSSSVLDRSHANHVEQILDRAFETGTSIEYAAEHEYGVGQTKRSFISVDESHLDKMGEAIADWGLSLLAEVR